MCPLYSGNASLTNISSASSSMNNVHSGESVIIRTRDDLARLLATPHDIRVHTSGVMLGERGRRMAHTPHFRLDPVDCSALGVFMVNMPSTVVVHSNNVDWPVLDTANLLMTMSYADYIFTINTPRPFAVEHRNTTLSNPPYVYEGPFAVPISYCMPLGVGGGGDASAVSNVRVVQLVGIPSRDIAFGHLRTVGEEIGRAHV